MAVDRESSLIEEVYACDVCSASAYGFTRPSEGRPYYKFPPTIGATGQDFDLVCWHKPASLAEQRTVAPRSNGQLAFI